MDVRGTSLKLYAALSKAKSNGWLQVQSKPRLGQQAYWGMVTREGPEYLIKLPGDTKIIRIPTQSGFNDVEAAIRARLQELHRAD